MLVHKVYKTDEERDTIIAQMEADGYTQVSVEGYFVPEGHLLFDDNIPSVTDLLSEVAKLEARLTKLEPDPNIPPLCTHWAKIDSINLSNEKPITVKRTWSGKEYIVDCYVTESIKDQYLAGDIAIGDFVLVEFLDDNPDRAVVFSKVLKTW